MVALSGPEVAAVKKPTRPSSPGSKWYPGHMVATQRTIRELAPYLTAFVEVVDARAPESTRHRPLAVWVGRTPLVLVLNKEDLADPAVTRRWVAWYQHQGVVAVALNAGLSSAAQHLRRAITQKWRSPYRLAVVGLPNLGKSTLLNRMVGRHRVATGAKPGITRGPQWIRQGDGWEWLDLPGVVTPAKSHDPLLKILGVVPFEPQEADVLAARAWQWLYPEAAEEAWLEFGRSRGFLAPGGVVDRQRTAEAILAAVRQGGMGRFSFEAPKE